MTPINIDFGPLITLLQQIADAVNPTVFVPKAVQALGDLIYTGIRSMFLALWNATLLGIPHALSDQFGPVVAMMPPPGAIAVAGLVLTLSLLGIRTYVRGMTGRGGILDELLGRVMVYLSVLSMLPWIIGQAIDLENTLAKAVAIDAIASILPNIPPVLDIPQLFGLLAALVLGIRLWLKLASNVIHVMVAIVWSPAALVCGLIPEASWVTSLWIREFVGRLAGAVLATIAVGLGFAFALTQSGLLAIFGTAGAFLAAADLVDWLSRAPGQGMGGLAGMGLRMGVGLMGGGGGAVSAGAQAAAMRSLARSDAATATQRFYSYD